MRKLLLTLISLITILFFSNCSSKKHVTPESNVTGTGKEDEGKEEKEDGIRMAQEADFEMTKDISLGYIPLNRLISATEELQAARLRGTAQNRTNALSWTERGPNTDIIGPSNGNTRGTQAATDAVTSGRMRAIWVDLTSSVTVWAGGIDGGLWKSTNIASTSAAVWSPVNDFFSNLAVSSICQDPSATNIMYFGTGEKTFNADAVEGGGVWKSTNNGVSWTLLTNTTTFTNVSKVLCDAAGNVYVATIGANGIQRSTDGGTNWTNITPTGLTSRVTEMKISSTGRLHIVCGYQNDGVSGYRYTDIPATVGAGGWTAPVTTFPAEWNTELAVGGSGSTLYALPSNASDLTPAIYKSTDGGANWATTTTSPPGTGSEPTINAGQGWYDLAIGVDPANDDIVIAGGLNFYRTTNGGATWTQITRWVGTVNNYVHADHHTVTWNGTQVLVGTDGGIFYSSDNGVTFADRNDGLRLKQFYSGAIHPTTTNYFLGGTQDNGTHQLTSAGLGGSVEVMGGDGGYSHIDQDDPTNQFTSTTFSNYIRSVNGGTSWASFSLGSIGQFINPTDYDDINNKLYTSAAGGQYIRWEDAATGASFSAVSIGAFNSSTVRSVTVSPHTANRVFFGTAGGRVVRVDNANTSSPTGTHINSGAGMSASTVSCVAVGTTDNNLLATFSNYGAIHVWVSTDGSTWTNISGTGLPDIPVRWAMFYPEDNTKAILATEMGIYETDLINGASTLWVQNSTFPVVRTNMLQYRKSDGTVLAATHGRGMWTAPIPLTTPYVRFAAPHVTQSEVTTTTTGCRNYTDYTLNMNIDVAPTGAAGITLTIAGGNTATQGVDFDFTTNGDFSSPSSVLTFPNGSTTPQPITIRIYNDAVTESTESFAFNYSIGGGTNAQAAPSSTSSTFFITDNDLSPVVSVTATVGTTNTNLSQPFRGEFSDAKTRMVFLASELTGAGFSAGLVSSIGFNVTTKSSTAPYQNFTIKMKNSSSTTFVAASKFETSMTQVYGPVSYSTVAGVNTFVLTTPFNWDGTSNLVIEICYDNTAGTAADLVSGTSATPRCDFDRVNGAAGCALTLANFQFAGGGARPVITFTIGSSVESVLNNNRAEHVPDNSTYHFYSGGSIINSLTAASAALGCVTSTIFETGNTWQTFSGGQRSQKVIDVVPTTGTGATYTISVYFTAAELAGKPPASLRLAKTTAATMAGANSSNTVTVSTTFASFGSDYVFTGSFTGFSKFFLIDNNVTLPVNLLSFSGYLNNQSRSQLQWKTTNEFNLREFEVQRSFDGVDFVTIGKVNAVANPATVQDYDYTDPAFAKAVNFYRLRMVDIDARFKYSAIIKISNTKPAGFAELVGNPVRDNIAFIVNNRNRDNISATLFNGSGQLVKRWDIGKIEGFVTLPLDIQIPSGSYILRVSTKDLVENLRIIKQ